MYKAVIFDCDGVIINSEIMHMNSSNEAYSDFGISFHKGEYFAEYNGIPDRDKLKKKILNSNINISDRDISLMLEMKKRAYIKILSNMKELPFMPGVKEYIRFLFNQGKSLGVCSGSTGEEVNLVLERLGNGEFLKYFTTVVSIDDVEKGKPDPEGYALACKNVGQKTSDCLAIEDSPSGIMSARKAGLDVYGILSTHSAEQLSQAKKLFKDFNDIDMS
ncbi:MAG: HAD family phosphatase [Legionellaceae bacterium]|nr:HAD family phosphatase [Legionellaceae bacterium]